jgi:hypothetical protein
MIDDYEIKSQPITVWELVNPQSVHTFVIKQEEPPKKRGRLCEARVSSIPMARDENVRVKFPRVTRLAFILSSTL